MTTLRPMLAALLACCCWLASLSHATSVSVEAKAVADAPHTDSSPPAASVGHSTVWLDSSSSLTHFSFGSCNKQDKPQPMWQHIMERQPQLWIWLGDVIYADRATLEFFRRPSPIAEMKKMYAQQYEQVDYTRLRQSDTKIVGIYDDHDYGENDGDATYVDKEPARHLFLDFVDEPAASPRRDRLGVYESYKWGNPAPLTDATATTNATSTAAPSSVGGVTQLILLDSRYHQDAAADDMLGASQWQWLEALLADPAPVDLFIVGSGVQLVSRDKRIGEGWRLLPKSRARLLDLFARRPHNRNAMLLFLSGDVHFAESDVTYTCAAAAAGPTTAAGADVDSVTVTPFYELTSSGMTHSVGGQFGRLTAEWGLPLVLDERRSWAEDSGMHPDASIRGFYSAENFGDVVVDWAAQSVRVEYVDTDGTTKLGHTLPFSALRSSTVARAQLSPLVRDVCAEEDQRARSPAMWVLPGVKAGLAIILALMTALATTAWLALQLLHCLCATRRQDTLSTKKRR